MYEIDLRRVMFADGGNPQFWGNRLAVASISSVLSNEEFRALSQLHLFASGNLAKLPDVSDNHLITLNALGFLDLNDDKTLVILR